ncbi:ribonuclease M5 [Lentibacillus amyloliquefaciens]|uniref:Ribonuclease M5 n=1 Tax=Lentibacillus amyloliquefaciens TaxID=1472767 RepID=A0A0U4G9M7_9BACI|nr:ribonuclease M5 [Lentibacillus amyloliquefaciens]ALX49450.1 ribonuclease M5 [Lentibacillus amyloliquefaciens]
MKIKEVIVVEGRDDTAKITQTVDADTIETNGSAVGKSVIKQIGHAQAKRGVIIFTDPDYPGKRIRHIIDQAVPGCKHAFLPRDAARAKNSDNQSLGIEHASSAAIKHALQGVYSLSEENYSGITREDLIAFGLIGGSKARTRRTRLGELLQIGHTNGKQLLRRLRMFHITKDQFDEAMSQVMQEENNDC